MGSGGDAARAQCAIGGCAAPPAADAPVPLCGDHARLAYEWVALEQGATDLLPSPCLACGSRLGVHYASGWLCAICEWRYGDVPDRELLDARVDVVYYVGSGDRIKIGTTSNPRSRFHALRVERVLAFERGGRVLEQRRHAQFAELRFPGSEWFRTEPPLIEHITALAAGVDDPWSLYARWVSERLATR